MRIRVIANTLHLYWVLDDEHLLSVVHTSDGCKNPSKPLASLHDKTTSFLVVCSLSSVLLLSSPAGVNLCIPHGELQGRGLPCLLTLCRLAGIIPVIRDMQVRVTYISLGLLKARSTRDTLRSSKARSHTLEPKNNRFRHPFSFAHLEQNWTTLRETRPAKNMEHIMSS